MRLERKNNLTPVSGIPQQSGAASNPIKQKSSYSANIVTAITVGIVGVCLLVETFSSQPLSIIHEAVIKIKSLDCCSTIKPS